MVSASIGSRGKRESAGGGERTGSSCSEVRAEEGAAFAYWEAKSVALKMRRRTWMACAQ